MKIKSKVSKYAVERKHIEIPKAVRDNFELGEGVYIEKVDGGKKDGRKQKN